MLQLNYSQATNTNAVYPDTPASVGTNKVLLDFTQSINHIVTPNVTASLANTVSLSNPWLIIQLAGTSVPTASGQYNVNIYEYTLGTSGSSVWSLTTTTFVTEPQTWGGQGGIIKGNLVSTERAYVSGSDEYSVSQYLLPTSSLTYTYVYP